MTGGAQRDIAVLTAWRWVFYLVIPRVSRGIQEPELRCPASPMRPGRRLCARTGRANRAAGLAPGGLDRDWRQQNLSGTFYYLCSILDGTRRSIDHYEIREPMTEQAVGELSRAVEPM